MTGCTNSSAPNVDFYSGIVFRALGFPTSMFTVLFAVGRVPGWIAHWKEMMADPKRRIVRPRQLYVGKAHRQPLPALPLEIFFIKCHHPSLCVNTPDAQKRKGMLSAE